MNELKIKEYSEKLWQMHMDISGFYNEYAKSVGLTLTEFKVLDILYRKRALTQKDITTIAYLPKQTVNAIIKGFISKNIIKELTESNLDKRNKEINFTEYGLKYAEKLISKAKEAEYKALDAIGEDEIKILIKLITEYKDNLKIE